MKVGFYQFRPQFGKPVNNLRKIQQALQGVSADLLVLPELALSGYFFADRKEAFALAEDLQDSSAVAALTQLCRERKFHLVMGLAEKQRDKVFNSAILVGPDGVEHLYRKLHLFNREKHWFDPGDTLLEIQTVNDVKIGIMICFDWIFPEVTRALALQGAQILCHPSNLVLQYCQQTMLARCLENGIFAVTANRYGTDARPHGELKFTGKSQIVAPKGVLLHRAASQHDALFIAEIDPEEANNKHITELNHQFDDRRPDFYSALTSRSFRR